LKYSGKNPAITVVANAEFAQSMSAQEKTSFFRRTVFKANSRIEWIPEYHKKETEKRNYQRSRTIFFIGLLCGVPLPTPLQPDVRAFRGT
jgi:hypothetical protein